MIPPILITYRTFIPSPAVVGPSSNYQGLSGYGGDNRQFHHSEGTHRSCIKILYDHSAKTERDKLYSQYIDFGITTEYNIDDLYQRKCDPIWFYRKKAIAKIINENKLNNDGFPLLATIQAKKYYDKLKIRLSASNPLVKAPSIDGEVIFHFRLRNGKLEYRLMITHDEFPSHELYINRSLIYSFDAMNNRVGPASLFGDTTSFSKGYSPLKLAY